MGNRGAAAVDPDNLIEAELTLPRNRIVNRESNNLWQCLNVLTSPGMHMVASYLVKPVDKHIRLSENSVADSRMVAGPV